MIAGREIYQLPERSGLIKKLNFLYVLKQIQ